MTTNANMGDTEPEFLNGGEAAANEANALLEGLGTCRAPRATVLAIEEAFSR